MASKNYDNSDALQSDTSQVTSKEILQPNDTSQHLIQNILVIDEESRKDDEMLSSHSTTLPLDKASSLLPEKISELSLGEDTSPKLLEMIPSAQSDVKSEVPQVKSDMQNSIHLPADKQLEEMIDMAEKVVIVLSLHFNDCCEGKVEAERAKIAMIGLQQVVSFVDSLPVDKKAAFFSELLSKPLYIEMLGAYFMRHWTGTCA